MPTIPDPSWGTKYFFPLAFSAAGSGRGFRTEHVQNDGADRFFALQSRGLWQVNLSGLSVLAPYIDSWDAFVEAIRGQWAPFLFRQSSRRFEILAAQPGGIGTGDGATTVFQLVKTRSYPNGPTNTSTETVRFPLHNYPAMSVPVGNGAGTVLYPTEYVQIWLDGVPMAWLSGWDIDRETGLITFDAAPGDGVAITAYCKFFVLLHGQDIYALQSDGASYSFPDGATLFQVASEV